MRVLAEESHTTNSPEATMEIAAQVAARLEPGDVVVLGGELGSGKTVFVRGAARALGFEGRVTSPTFAIGNVYAAPDHEIAHLDLYRLAELGTSDEAVLSDFLTPERIGFVEWPHDELAGEQSLRAIVELAHVADDRRTVAIRWVAPQGGDSDATGI